MRVGAHVSIAGGIDQAPGRAKEMGCDCFQIFCKNPRGWKARELSETEVNETKVHLHKMELDPMVVHISYLVNLASPKPDLYKKSYNGFVTELERTGRIGGKYLVLHPGKYTGTTKDEGIQRIATSINQAFQEVDNEVMLLLENVAGAGTEIGQTFEELQAIIELVENQKRIGICFDTCHGFAAGYDLRTQGSTDEVFRHFDQVIGFDKLRIIHANDAKADLGSNLDRHQHIGHGCIGEEGFRSMINHPLIIEYDVPFILETPEDEIGDFISNIAKLRELTE